MLEVIFNGVLYATSSIKSRVKAFLVVGRKPEVAMQPQRPSDRLRPPTASRSAAGVRGQPCSTPSSTSNSLRVPSVTVPSAPPPPSAQSDSSDDEDFYVDVRAPTPSVGSRDQRPSVAIAYGQPEARRQPEQSPPAAAVRASPRLDRDDRSNHGQSSTSARTRLDSHVYVGVVSSVNQRDGDARRNQRPAHRPGTDAGPYVLPTSSSVGGDDVTSPAAEYDVLLHGDKTNDATRSSICCVSPLFLFVSLLVNFVVTVLFAVVVVCWLTGTAGRVDVRGIWSPTLMESVESLGRCVVKSNALEEGDSVAVEEYCSRTAMNDTQLGNVILRYIRENAEIGSAKLSVPFSAGLQQAADRQFSGAHLFLRSDTHLPKDGLCAQKNNVTGMTRICGWSSQGEPFYVRNIHLEQSQNVEVRVPQAGTYGVYSRLPICRSAGGRAFTQRIASRSSTATAGSNRTLLLDSRVVAGSGTSAGSSVADCSGEPIDASVLFGSFHLEANDSLWIEADPASAVHRSNQVSFFGLYLL